MDADYPEHLLAREPAPPYEGEGPFALWHFSEDPSRSCGQARRRPDRASDHAVHLAVLAAGCGLDRRVQRLPSGQQRPASGPVRV